MKIVSFIFTLKKELFGQPNSMYAAVRYSENYLEISIHDPILFTYYIFSIVQVQLQYRRNDWKNKKTIDNANLELS